MSKKTSLPSEPPVRCIRLVKMRHRYAWARMNWWQFWWLFADRCGGVPTWLDRKTERAEENGEKKGK